jgi:cell division septal protein FtsQ
MRGRSRAGAGHAGLTRTERASLARRKRALEHLERVRGQAGASRTPRLGVAGGAGALLAISVAAGVVLGPARATVARAWLSGDAPRLEAIHVSGLERLSGAEVAAATGLAPGTAASEVDPRAVVEQLQSHAWVAAARAVRVSGGILLVEVRERVPRAVAPAGPDAVPFFVDATGTPFAPADAASSDALPRLVPANPVAPGEPDAGLAAAVALARRLPDFGLAVPARVRIAAPDDPEGFILDLAGLSARVVLGREDLDDRLAGLARLLAAGLSDVVEATSVDLRFEDQAVLQERPGPKGPAQVAAERGGATPSGTSPSG